MKNNIVGHLALDFITETKNQNHLLDALVSNDFDTDEGICLCDLEKTLAEWCVAKELDFVLFHDIIEKLPRIKEALVSYYIKLEELIGHELEVFDDEVCWHGRPMSHKYLELREEVSEHMLEEWSELIFGAVFSDEDDEDLIEVEEKEKVEKDLAE